MSPQIRLLDIQARQPEIESPVTAEKSSTTIVPAILALKQILEGHYPANLDETVSFGFNERCCIKKIRWKALKKLSDAFLCYHTSCMHVHKKIY